jgi:hypothetical protein
LRAIVSRAWPTVEIEVCELFDRKLMRSDSVVSSVTAEGVSLRRSARRTSADQAGGCPVPVSLRHRLEQALPPGCLLFCVIGVAATRPIGFTYCVMVCSCVGGRVGIKFKVDWRRRAQRERCCDPA